MRKELLLEKCKEGFKEKITHNEKRKAKKELYTKRLNEEMELIVRQGFCEYFLIVEEIIGWCKENNIMTGPGRGSAGGSLVCYLLNITKIDPVEFNLLFSRFISPDRIDLPDIDNDFQDNKRYMIIEHFKEIYGEDHVATVSMPLNPNWLPFLPFIDAQLPKVKLSTFSIDVIFPKSLISSILFL